MNEELIGIVNTKHDLKGQSVYFNHSTGFHRVGDTYLSIRETNALLPFIVPINLDKSNPPSWCVNILNRIGETTTDTKKRYLQIIISSTVFIFITVAFFVAALYVMLENNIDVFNSDIFVLLKEVDALWAL